MLNRFDWLRRSRTGAELLSTLQYLEAHGKFPSDGGRLGPPSSGLNGPCVRCWIYPRAAGRARYCPTCRAILRKAWQKGMLSRHVVVVWGFVNQLPRQLRMDSSVRTSYIVGTYVHDENRFLLMLYHLGIKPWLQELAIYHGAGLKGLIQIFPTTGSSDTNMGDLLCRIIHNEARFPRDQLRVRFFSTPHEILAAHLYERQGILTFEVTEFLNMLEMASVFRSILRPDDQEILYKLLNIENTNEAQFYWGRFLGSLGQEAKDMLNAWKIRQWSKPWVDLLYQLVKYVEFYQSH